MSTGKPDGSRSGVLPWTHSCFVCGQDNPHGLRLRSRMEGEKVVLDYTPRESDVGWRHIVHGGITMSLLDEVMTWAAILAIGRPCVAAEMSTRLKKPILLGHPVRVEGEIVEAGRRLVRTHGRVLGDDERELAVATGKYTPMPGDRVQLCEKDFVDSPQALDLSALTAHPE